MSRARSSGIGIDRREAIAVAAATGLAGAARGTSGDRRNGLVVDQGTNIALTASPDGKRIAIDLYGVLWQFPIGGGRLVRLTDDYDDVALPDWSPDGERIAVQSYRDGRFRIWAVPAAGGAMMRLTAPDGFHDDREPCWSPDGRSIALASDRSDGRYAIHVLDLSTGRVTPFSHGPGEHSEPVWTRDGDAIAYVVDGTSIVVQPAAGCASRELVSIARSHDKFHPAGLHAPAFAPDGTLVHTRHDDGGMTLVAGGRDIVSGTDLYPFRPAWASGDLLYGADGHVRRHTPRGTRIVPFETTIPVVRAPHPHRPARPSGSRRVMGIVAPALSPDGRHIVFGALNDLWLMPVGGAPRRLVSDGYCKADPAWSPDGRTVAYATDRGGTMDIWLRDVAGGTDRQLTALPAQAASAPAWSPDGSAIAFLDQDGALHGVDVASGAVRRFYGSLWQPGRPSFGPGGRTIACAAFKPVSARFREGASEILTIDVATGQGRYAPHAPGKSLATRGLDGPVWSPDGRFLAYVFASTLWVRPVRPDGAFAGPARQVTSEVADAPSWSGDSASLLYLSNGRLRLAPVEGGSPRTIPCILTWAEPERHERTVVSVDRFWDGDGGRYRGPADIVIVGDRIAGMANRGETTDESAKRIDGTGLTALPGLIDMHTHRQMQGYGYGDRMGRLWLALGITATRSPGAPAYHMVEDREAISSGIRIAPRHYATGEALDGGRIFYNFMRPVTEPGQLDLELSRVGALSYDLVKTYVRLPHDVQAEIARRSHALGLPVTSHYHYPAIAHGIGGMEHMGATTRAGYARTMTAQGGGYRDVTALFAAAEAQRTPTLFMASALLREDDRFVRDPRVVALMPPWELKKLRARVQAMREGDPIPLRRSLARQVDQIRATMAAGWRVIAGTDAPIDFVAISLHLNLRAMARFGISVVDALKTATANAGDALNEPIGRIGRGKLADLILVGGDPLIRIEDAADVRHIFAMGRHHVPDSLAAPFEATTPSGVEPAFLAYAGHAAQPYWERPDYVEDCRAACCRHA